MLTNKNFLVGPGDTSVNSFTVANFLNRELSSTLNTSVSPTGFDTTISWSVTTSGSSISTIQTSLDGTNFSSTNSGNINPGQTIYIRMTTVSSFGQSGKYFVTLGPVGNQVTAGGDVTTRIANIIPAQFTFTDVSNVELSTLTTSSTITVTGLEPNYSVTFTASGGTIDAGTSSLSGTYASSKTVTTSGTGTCVLAARVTSSGSYSTSASVTVSSGGVSDTFTATTRAADLTPNQFTFTDISGAELNTTRQSNTITVTGFDPNVSVTFTTTNGTIDAGTSTLSGTFASSKTVTTSGTGTCVLAARVTSSGSYSTSASATVACSGVSDVFTVTTRAVDGAPNQFTFTDISGAELNTTRQSDTITVTGFDPNVNVTFTASGGTIDAGTSALSTAWASSKTVTTSGTGTCVLAARVTSSSSFSTAANVTVTCSGVSDTFTVTTRAADTTPDQFTFTDVSNVNPNTSQTSSTITVTGLEPNYSVTFTCDAGQIDAGTSALSGTFASSKTVTTSGTGTCVLAARVTSSSSFSTGVNVAVSSGGISDTFTVTTRAIKTAGSSSFTDISSQALQVAVQSSVTTISGLEPSTSYTISASGGTVAMATYGTTPSSFAASATAITDTSGRLSVIAATTTSPSYSTAKTVTLSLVVTSGSIPCTLTDSNWSATTLSATDDPPDQFAFTDTTNVELNTTIQSSTITVTGLAPSASVTFTASGGTIDAGASSLSGTFASSKTITTSASGTCVLAARVTSSTSYLTKADVTVTCNGVSDTFSASTRTADVTPDQFTFTDVSSVEPNTSQTSSTITVTGFDPNVSVTFTASGGTIDAGTSSLSGTYASSKTVTTSASGTCVLAARVTSSGSFSTGAGVTVTCSGVSDTFTVTTRAADTTPDQFTFTDVSNVNPNTSQTSSTITVTGLEPNYSVTFTCDAGQIDAGTSALSGTWATSKTVTTSGTGTCVLAARVTSSSSFNVATNTTVSCGGVSDTFTVTTRVPDLTGTVSGISNITSVEPNTSQTSATGTISGLEPNYTITLYCNTGTIDAGTSTLSGTFASSKTVTTSASGTCVFAFRVTSSANFSTSVTSTLFISSEFTFSLSGTVSFAVTTRAADVLPSQFTFTDVSNAQPNTLTQSNTVTVTGLEPNYPITFTCGTGQIDAGTSALSGTWATSKTVTTSGTGTCVLAARITSSGGFSGSASMTVSCGSINDTFTVTTRAADLTGTVSGISTTVTNQPLSTTYTTGTAYITGLEPNYSITLTVTGGSIDAGTSTLSGTWSTSSKTVTTDASGACVVAMRLTTASTVSTTTTVSMALIGGTLSGTTSVSVTTIPPSGEAIFNTVGDGSWTVPANVNSICVLCIGGGGSGGTGANQGYGGGSGGGLAYCNNIAVTPGQTLYYRVGAGGENGTSGGSSAFSWTSPIGNSADYLIGFAGVSTTTISGNTGGGGIGFNHFSSYVSRTGGKGGNSINATTSYGGGGGGAAGYGGNGGAGGNSATGWLTGDATNGTAGSGGGGGGGAGDKADGTTNASGSGGGVGLYGQGANGAGGTVGTSTSKNGGGGSGGDPGHTTNGGGWYGGGGGAANGQSSFTGGRGAIRIIWGNGRSFPSNAA